MVEFMAKLRKEITIGVVGGSDLPKQKEQLGESGGYCSHIANRKSFLCVHRITQRFSPPDVLRQPHRTTPRHWTQKLR